MGMTVWQIVRGGAVLHGCCQRRTGFTLQGCLLCNPLYLPSMPPAGDVILPLDLLRFEPRFRPAILRAFGSHVLAANNAGAPWNADAQSGEAAIMQSWLLRTALICNQAWRLKTSTAFVLLLCSGGAADHTFWRAVHHA